MINLEELVVKVADLARKAGAFIRKESETFKSSHIEYKGLNNLVSYVDKEAEKMLVAGLEKMFPEAGFITEEGTATHNDDHYKWIIDPLDGTTNFIHGIPTFAVSIALIRGDKVVLGVVYEVNHDECFYATESGDAYLNGKVMRVSDNKVLKQSLVATGFPFHDFERMPEYMRILHRFMEKTHGLRRIGSAAVDLAYVASGRFEGFFEYNLNAWDVAAGVLLVKRAGGVVTDFKGGDDYVFGRELVAACGVHAEMLELIREIWDS
jgi:myo-inositol-1(or 4)-monophosphatase